MPAGQPSEPLITVRGGGFATATETTLQHVLDHALGAPIPNPFSTQTYVPYRDSSGNWALANNAFLYPVSRFIPGTIATATDVVPWIVAPVSLTFVTGVASIVTTDAVGNVQFVIKKSTDGGTNFSTVSLISGDMILATTRFSSGMVFNPQLTLKSADVLRLDMVGNTTTAANFAIDLTFKVAG